MDEKQSEFYSQENKGNLTELIYADLKKDYSNYKLYYKLGKCLEDKNINQAFLCMENAEFFCTDEEAKIQIRTEKERMAQKEDYGVRPVAIVILSYNLKQICIQCVESVRKNNLPDSYEIIAVDNASSDGICEWLQEQEDITLIRNQQNVGFPAGCNQGIQAAGNQDILILNNDIELQPNSVFCLRMGLYESGQVGAAGCVTNYAGNGQAVHKNNFSIEEWRNYAKETNVPCENPYECKFYLGGFALLLRHGLLEQIGMFDERFSPGYYEDTDLGIRIARAGCKQLLCRNSFVLHYGSASFQAEDKTNQLAVNKQKIIDKWGFDIEYYSEIRQELIEMIDQKPEAPIRVLEVGCGCGSTLARIKALWPNAVVKGIEVVWDIAQIGKSLADICQGDIESMDLPYENGYFDYIICGDVLEHLKEPQKTLQRLKPCLKKNGFLLASIPNVTHMSVILGLLKGTARYQEAGILDKTHLRFFTQKTAINLFQEAGFQIVAMSGILDRRCWLQEEQLIDDILKLPGIADENSFMVSQYLLKALCL